MFGNLQKGKIWQNFQTSLVLLIPNCTRHRMITYTYTNEFRFISWEMTIGRSEVQKKTLRHNIEKKHLITFPPFQNLFFILVDFELVLLA
jgi:hypothetical protein